MHQGCRTQRELSIQPKIPEISVGWNRPFRFGPIGILGTSFEGGPLWPVQLSCLVGPKCPFPFDKIVIPSTALLYSPYKNKNKMCCGVGRVCATGIFVEWKVPLVSVPGSQQHIPTLKFVKNSHASNTKTPRSTCVQNSLRSTPAMQAKLKIRMVHPRFIYRPTGRCLYEWFKKFVHCLETPKWMNYSHSFLSFNIYWINNV